MVLAMDWDAMVYLMFTFYEGGDWIILVIGRLIKVYYHYTKKD